MNNLTNNTPPKYYDVVINNNGSSFYIQELNQKPKAQGSAKDTLTKIDYIMKHSLAYDKSKNDLYSIRPAAVLFRDLNGISKKIRQDYSEKQAKLNWLFRKIFSNLKQITKIQTQISTDISQAILHCEDNAVNPLVARAEKHGYAEIQGVAVRESANRALFFAIKKGEKDTVQFLLGKGANPNGTCQGLNPLHVAAHYGHIEIANLLLNAGADIDKQSENMLTPFVTACREGKNEMAELLLRRGANPNIRDPYGVSDIPDNSGRDVLTGLALTCALFAAGS